MKPKYAVKMSWNDFRSYFEAFGRPSRPDGSFRACQIRRLFQSCWILYRQKKDAIDAAIRIAELYAAEFRSCASPTIVRLDPEHPALLRGELVEARDGQLVR